MHHPSTFGPLKNESVVLQPLFQPLHVDLTRMGQVAGVDKHKPLWFQQTTKSGEKPIPVKDKLQHIKQQHPIQEVVCNPSKCQIPLGKMDIDNVPIGLLGQTGAKRFKMGGVLVDSDNFPIGSDCLCQRDCVPAHSAAEVKDSVPRTNAELSKESCAILTIPRLDGRCGGTL